LLLTYRLGRGVTIAGQDGLSNGKTEGRRGGRGVKVKIKRHGEGRSERELTLVFKWQ
jgi:hypothetical protein